MKSTFIKIVSLTLIMTLLCSTTVVFANENKVFSNEEINIKLVEEIQKDYNIELPDDAPLIKVDKTNEKFIMPFGEETSTYGIAKRYTRSNVVKPKIEFTAQGSLSVPPNDFDIEETYVSKNKYEPDDLERLEKSKGLNADSVDQIVSEQLGDAETIANSSERTLSSSPADGAYRMSDINSKDSYALQNQTGRTNYIGDNLGGEYIDSLTGNLIVTETDLVLPGVDGLDLNLSRYYSLAQAELYTKTAGLSTDSKHYAVPEGWYIVTENVTNTETNETSTYSYAYSTQAAANKRIAEIESRDTYNGTFIYQASYEVSSDGDQIDYPYYYTSDITSSSYSTVTNNLGVGWSWSFPSIQTIKDDYDDENEIPKAIYYHDGNGNVMEIERDALNNWSFANYVGRDIEFEILGDFFPEICSFARIDYMVEDADCTKYYFGPHGELRSIIDTHGNKIQFSYTEKDFYGVDDWPVIEGIVDSVGRNVSFRYTTDGEFDYIEITVTSPIASEGNIELVYKKKMINVTYMDEYLSAEPFLESVEYPNGDVTSYYPASVNGERSYAQPLRFTFADKSFQSDYIANTSGYSNTLTYLLGNVVRPHSNTYYNYELCERNLGHSGVCEAYRVAERGDYMLVVDDENAIVESEDYSSNVISYDYGLDYTGYNIFNSIDNIPEGNYVSRTKEIKESSTVTKRYYKKDGAVLELERETEYINPVGNNLTVKQYVEEYLNKQPLLTKLTYLNEDEYTYDSYVYSEPSASLDKTFGKPLIQTDELDYDTVDSDDKEKHAMLYTYDSDTGFMISRSWHKSDDSKCTERFTYDSNNRLISYQAPDGTTTTYTYEYTNGKVSKKTTRTENDTGTTVIVENFTSSTGYAFPSTVIKTVTAGNTITTETTSYTYDLLYGVVKSMTDNDENTTYYEYDALGRLTKTVHPEYSTYSSYGNKNVKILPIENTTYESVRYNYEGITNTGENLLAQRISNTVSYYDVSNNDTYNPSDAELNEESLIFYGYNSELYLGTGELIESNVLDIVEDDYAINTTMYYYNTATNLVREVDAKGNVTITQFDGTGREVKVTDQFDNYHITEYNISGDGVGFKALSYFVPASDRNKKENMIEYTYDRLGRTTKEKAYSVYPDSFVEVKYEYDYVGNVIGIIDANNTLNEDGYTQTNTYDKLNRVISSKNANNETIRNTYDALGNIKKQTITDCNGTESVLYQRNYDGDGKIISDTDNAGNSNLYVYDGMGRLHISQDKNSKHNTFGYNELGVLDSTSNAIIEDSIIARNYAYRNPYGPNTVYDLRGVYDESDGQYQAYINEITQYSYSPSGNITSQYGTYAVSTGMSGVYFKPYMSYEYDSTGNITSAFYGTLDNTNQRSFGATTHYEYNKNRLSKVQINGSGTKNTSDSVNVAYEYYDDGKLKSVTYPTLTDGTVLKSVYLYDGLSRLISLVNYKGNEILSSYSYTYDCNGNILTTNETVGNALNSVTYTYDKLNRIATVSGTKGADSYYEYDARGNRKANFEQIDFLSEESAIFIYDTEDMLDRCQVGSEITYFEYSANGYRYFKRENSEYPEYYVYDSNGRLQAIAAAVTLTMTDGSTLPTMYPLTYYIWGPDRVLSMIDVLAGRSYYYLYNGHGDVVQIVDTSGAIKNSYDYDVWGNFLTKEESIENHFTYFGQTYDETTGLYYLRARYYDPTTGRFTQQDPAEDGYNWYVYGNQNPVIFIDIYGCSNERLSDGMWSYKNDKFGVSILSHWLFGGGAEYVQKDGMWGAYMKDNSLLRSEVREVVLPLANGMKNNTNKSIDITTSMVIQNGEDIIGYQYLHGTNANVGGFQIKGTISKNKKGDVTYDLTYTWNDRIDPNFDYQSDAIKAEFAKSIPLAKPTDYTIRITWSDKTIIRANPTWMRGNSGWLK